MPESTDIPIDPQQTIDSLRRELAEVNTKLETAQRRAALDGLLRDAGAADAEAARTLAEAALASMETPDPEAAVAEVKRRRPYLFTRRASLALGSPALSPHLPHDDAPPAEHAAQHARATGDRRDLLAYLRLRRAK